MAKIIYRKVYFYLAVNTESCTFTMNLKLKIMKTVITIQDLKGNILAINSNKSKAFKKAMSLIGDCETWITCDEAHYNKTIKATYLNMCERLNKYNKTSIDSIDLMLTIKNVNIDE